MFELIIFEIIGLLESTSRYFHWRLELTLLLFMVIALIPFYIAYSSISNIRFGMIIFLNNTQFFGTKLPFKFRSFLTALLFFKIYF